ncbi:semaphorin-7A [Bombina bombina]|uniref:semaphorin-7A n=1 Tax=Bombina bombina TaxID=8345 RepID=UPI00235AFD53|nr:semaphorin-7A [Bombina bombina]
MLFSAQHVILYILILMSQFVAFFGDLRMNPRINKKGTNSSFMLLRKEPYPVFYLSSPNSLYVGGKENLFHFNFSHATNNTFPIPADHHDCQKEKDCYNYVTLVGHLEGKLLVCGTNSYNPGCWYLDEKTFTKNNDLAEEFSPEKPGTNFNILITGNETYSTIVHQTNNGRTMQPKFKKIHGSKPLLCTGDKLVKNPHYVKALLVEKEDRDQDKILLFFREDNKESQITEPRVSMVAQLCKGDQGVDSSINPYEFGTAMKSRLLCGNEKTLQFYPTLQDVFLLKSKEGTRIYGLFTSAWNHSAVCSYKLEDIENIFSTSGLLNYQGIWPMTTNGCPKNRAKTPEGTYKVLSEHPELKDKVKPKGQNALFQIPSHYTKMVVDEVTYNSETYIVIILASGDGAVHKFVQIKNDLVNVLGLHPFKKPEEIQYMELEPKEHALYVGTTQEVAKIRLDDCKVYNSNCEECVCSRDPYCGWTESGGCQSIFYQSTSMIRDIVHRNTSKCPQDVPLAQSRKVGKIIKEQTLPEWNYTLKCHQLSQHASYSWQYNDNHMMDCTHHDVSCTLLLGQEVKDGIYQCLEKEDGKERIVYEYQMQRNNSSIRIPPGYPLLLLMALVWHLYYCVETSHLHL